jgi:hypothetical protein
MNTRRASSDERLPVFGDGLRIRASAIVMRVRFVTRMADSADHAPAATGA